VVVISLPTALYMTGSAYDCHRRLSRVSFADCSRV
jgi:hypothetical protein